MTDALVLQFVNDWELLSLCARRGAARRITIFEGNDYLFREATPGMETVAVLSSACKFFPGSAAFVAEPVIALHRSGQLEAAYEQFAKGSSLRQQAILYQQEFPQEKVIDPVWQFADHIHTISTFDHQTCNNE